MLTTLRRLLGKEYVPLNIIEISKESIEHNYHYLSKLNPHVQIAPVLKSNAYGHGLVEVAKIVDKLSAQFLCVDSLFEAYELYKAGIKTPILVMGYVSPQNLSIKKLPFSYAVFSIEMLRSVAKYQPQASVHIFVDTGMHREGVSLDELDALLKEAKSLGIKIEGIMSHLAKAQSPSDPGTKEQMRNFAKARKITESNGVSPRFVHITASSGLLNHKSLGDVGNVSRVGTALYGIDPESVNENLKPALTFLTTIVQLKDVKAGSRIGYDFTFKATKNMRLAVLPAGYNDGVDRGLSNLGVVNVNGHYCQIVGRVSMNITLIDVTSLDSVGVGDKVEIYSAKVSANNSIFESARKTKNIPYQFLVHLDQGTRRVVVP
jgi:alanine racemase